MTQSHKTRRVPLPRREAWRKRISRAQRIRSKTYRRQSLLWRLLVPAVFLMAGALFVTSAISSDGTDLRAGRYGDLGSVVRQQKEEADKLRAEVNSLQAEVDRLSTALSDTDVDRAQRAVSELRSPAGLEAVRGPGLTITLDDAPDEELAVVTPDDLGSLVVHQQDIQAVANAMWAGGAEAMTIQGQRVISTTGIKCVGNTVVLHGIPYSPPYVITAVGDPAAMLEKVNESPYIEIYLQYVQRYRLGWSVEPHSDVLLPGYEGSLELEYARPAGKADGPTDDEV